MGYRVLVLLVSGCASSAAIGAGGTGATGGSGGGFAVTTTSDIGFRVAQNVDLGLTSNLNFGNWTRAGNAYGQLNEWARSGGVDCCDSAAPILTFFKYLGLGMGYMTAWFLASESTLVGPRLRYFVQPYAPTLYFDLGAGPAALFDEDRGDVIFGIGSTVAAGYMFTPTAGIEVRSTWGNVNDPQWATFSVGLVIKPKKKFFGLFGRNDLERPPAKPQPPPAPPPTSGPPGSQETITPR